MDYFDKAKRVLEDWLILQFDEADLADVLNNDPDSVDLTDEEWDIVLDRMKLIKLAHVHLV